MMETMTLKADSGFGGGGLRFPETHWSRILGRATADPVEPLTLLARDYWKPIYAYIRMQWAKSHEDGKDLTQEFFVWIVDSGLLGRVQEGRGRFRAFLKTSLSRFLIAEDRKVKSLKRGGAFRFVEIDDAAAAGIPPAKERTPEEHLDDVWKAELLKRAAERLEISYRGEDREVNYRVFHDYLLSESEDLDHRQVADRLGISLTDVANCLTHARQRFRQILMDLVAETVETPEDLADEFRSLFGAARFD